MNARLERYLLPGTLAVVAAALALLVALNTEWVDVDIPRPLRGPAASDDLYILQRVLENLGVRVQRRDDLLQLPPPGEPLLLDAWIWGVFPERDGALENWVRKGGRLIVNGDLVAERGRAGPEWIAVAHDTRPPSRRPSPDRVPAPQVDADESDESDDGESASQGDVAPGNPQVPPTTAPVVVVDDKMACFEVAEPAGTSPAYAETLGSDGKPRPLVLCGSWWRDALRSPNPAVWGLQGDGGMHLLRIAVGDGSVTVLPRIRVFHNRLVLRGDNAPIAVAALQAVPGTTVWMVADRSRTGLLAWTWENGAAAVLAALAALALWLRRVSDRFGPRAPAPEAARRSMIEQIRGTAAFLWQRSPGALHAAQMRALEEIARGRIRGYASLDPVARVAALAQASGVDTAVIARAMQAPAQHRAHDLAQGLAVLEAVRRSLLDKARPGQRAATLTSQESSR